MAKKNYIPTDTCVASIALNQVSSVHAWFFKYWLIDGTRVLFLTYMTFAIEKD